MATRPRGRYINTDPSPENLRALWDRFHTQGDLIDEQRSAITTQAGLIAALQAQLVQTTNQTRSVLRNILLTTPPTPTGTTPGTNPNPGPVVPPPGTPPPSPPPNQPPLVEAPPLGDNIPIGSITIVNSVNVAAWPVTSTITQIDWQASGLRITHSKEVNPGSWPDVTPIGFTGPLQYTAWLILKIGGVWYGSGVIQYWRYGPPPIRNGGPPTGVGANWFFGSAWGPMSHYQPAFAEQVGIMVTSGNARNNATDITMERSQIVQISFPSNAGGIYTPT